MEDDCLAPTVSLLCESSSSNNGPKEASTKPSLLLPPQKTLVGSPVSVRSVPAIASAAGRQRQKKEENFQEIPVEK